MVRGQGAEMGLTKENKRQAGREAENTERWVSQRQRRSKHNECILRTERGGGQLCQTLK